MRESDRVFIKKTIEDTIEKKLENFLKKNDEQNKKFQQDLISRNDKDKKQVLDNLRKRDNKGQNTMAQKFERLKLESDKMAKSGGRTLREGVEDVRYGARRVVGSVVGGVDDAIKSVASITPETAMLYNVVRGLIGAGYNITSGIIGGTGNIAWGGLKGLFGLTKGALGLGSRGVASLLGASTKLFGNLNNKDDNNDNTSVQIKGKNKSTALTQNDNTDTTVGAKGVLKQKSKTGQQLNAFIKASGAKDKLFKTTSTILTKGLGGLGATLNLVSKSVGFIANNSKMILGGVTLGVLALLALKGWIEDGGLERLLDDALNKRNKKPHNTGDNTVKIGSPGNTTNDDMKKFISGLQGQSAGLGVSYDSVTIEKGMYGQAQIFDTRNKAIQDLNLRGRTRNAASSFANATNFQITKINNTDGLPLAFPFMTIIRDKYYKDIADKDQNKSNQCDIKLERVVKLGNNPQIIITNLNHVGFAKDQKIPKDTYIGDLGPDSVIIGDWKNFISPKTKGEKQMNAKEYWNSNKGTFAENYRKYRTPQMATALQQETEKAAKDTYSSNLSLLDKGMNKATDAYTGSEQNHNEYSGDTSVDINGNPTNTPQNNVNNGNESSNKANDQQEKLNQPKQIPQPTSNKTNNKDDVNGKTVGYVNTISTPDQYSTMLNAQEIGSAFSSRQTDSMFA